MGRYLKARAAAKYLGFGEDDKAVATIYQRVHRGQIPHTKIGRSLRFDTQKLDLWLADNAREADVA